MENEKKINWLSLFIKIIIVFIFALIIIWLISKIVNNSKKSEIFKNNINNMEKVSIDYFKTIDLPLEKGQSIKVTLEELIEKELIVSINEEKENKCNLKESYSEITREKDKYVVNTTLKCGKEKDTITSNFSLKQCRNCNQEENKKEENNKVEEKNEVDKVTYYEQVKETTTYTKWMRGNNTGNNIENRYEYYGIDYQTYYTLGVIPSDKTSITYTLKLDKVPNSSYYFTTIEEVTNYNDNEKSKYLNEKSISIYDGKKVEYPNELSKYSLRESNFTYKLSPYYRKGDFYVRVTINLKNTNGLELYYDNKNKENVYIVPLKINIKFASNEITETKPSGEYETISYYRYVTNNKETLWSTEEYIDGYKKTGNTQIK